MMIDPDQPKPSPKHIADGGYNWGTRSFPKPKKPAFVLKPRGMDPALYAALMARKNKPNG